MLTSKQNGIARPTLKRWEKLYGNEVFRGRSLTEAALAEIDVELRLNDLENPNEQPSNDFTEQ
jgi:hypothetical protein